MANEGELKTNLKNNEKECSCFVLSEIGQYHIFKVYQLESSYKNRNYSRHIKEKVKFMQKIDYTGVGRLKMLKCKDNNHRKQLPLPWIREENGGSEMIRIQRCKGAASQIWDSDL